MPSSYSLEAVATYAFVSGTGSGHYLELDIESHASSTISASPFPTSSFSPPLPSVSFPPPSQSLSSSTPNTSK